MYKLCSSSPPHSAATIARGLAAWMSEAWSSSRLYLARAVGFHVFRNPWGQVMVRFHLKDM